MSSNVLFKIPYSIFSTIRLLTLASYVFCGKILNRTFLIMTPVHGNLGDHAIAKAEIRYLKKYNIRYVEIPGKYLKILNNHHLLGLMNGATIIINGGGNIGTIWPEYEALIENVIKANTTSKIAIMPSTAYFENDDCGMKAACKAANVFRNHSDLTIFAREDISYDILKKLHSNVKLCPDIVFSMNETMPITSRHGCLICLREDREKTLSKETELRIRNTLSLYFDVIKDSKLDYFSKIKLSERSKKLDDKFREFRSAELVITDRMHGMVFAVITGTPCLVINSKSHKIVGTYQWVKNLDYICMLDNECEIEKAISAFIELPQKGFEYDLKKMLEAFQELEEYLKAI